MLDNDEIERRVRAVIQKIVKSKNAKRTMPEEELMIENATVLFVNFLQNINDIARSARDANS